MQAFSQLGDTQKTVISKKGANKVEILEDVEEFDEVAPMVNNI